MSHLRRLAPDFAFVVFLIVLAMALGAILDSTCRGSDDIRRGYVLTGKVERVADGDSFWLTTPTASHKIRLFAVDAPELNHKLFGKTWPEQPYAVQSRDVLKSMLIGNTVECTVIAKSYDRFVCTVKVGAKDVALEMVKAGAAWVEPRYNHSQALRDAQDEARDAKRGLFSDQYKPQIEPRFWRAGKR